MSATQYQTDDQPISVGGMMTAVALATALALALAGCVAAPAESDGARLPAAGPRSIAVSLDHPPVTYRMITERSTTGREAARGAAEGAGAGALFGLYLTLGLAAGTGGIALLAAPFIAGAGAVIGGVIGAADGAAGAEPMTLRMEPLDEVDGAMPLVAALDGSRLPESLRAAIAADARERTGARVHEAALPPSDGPAAGVEADMEIVVILLRVEFLADDEDDPDLSLSLSAMIRVIGAGETRTVSVIYRGRRDDLSDWAADDAVRFREELAGALEDLGRDIVSQALMVDPEAEPESCC
jgi:hypothetical protein